MRIIKRMAHTILLLFTLILLVGCGDGVEGTSTQPETIDFTNALLDGKSYYEYWKDSNGDYGEEIYKFNANTDGTYTVVNSWTDQNSAGIFSSGSVNMTAKIQPDGTLQTDFGYTDVDSGAIYSIVTLTDANTDSILIAWIEYNKDGAVVENSSKTWFISEQEPLVISP